MRGVRSFLLLLVVAGGLGAYLYFVESKRDPADADKKAKVFTVEADKIDELVVKSESGDRTTLKKTGTEWQVVEPVATPSDGAAVSGLTSNLSTLELQRVIDENPQDLGEYGLKEPRLEVAFKSGGKEQRLLVGRKTPAATDLYAKLGDSPRVFLIPGFVDTTFNKTTFDLRDKTVLKVNRDSVDTLVITTTRRPSARCSSPRPTASGSSRTRSRPARTSPPSTGSSAGSTRSRPSQSSRPKRPHSPSTASTSRPRRFSSGLDRPRPRSSSARPAEKASSTRRTSRVRPSSPSMRHSWRTSPRRPASIGRRTSSTAAPSTRHGSK